MAVWVTPPRADETTDRARAAFRERAHVHVTTTRHEAGAAARQAFAYGMAERQAWRAETAGVRGDWRTPGAARGAVQLELGRRTGTGRRAGVKSNSRAVTKAPTFNLNTPPTFWDLIFFPQLQQ